MSKEALKAQPIDSMWEKIAALWATSSIRRQVETTPYEKCLVSTGVFRQQGEQHASHQS